LLESSESSCWIKLGLVRLPGHNKIILRSVSIKLANMLTSVLG